MRPQPVLKPASEAYPPQPAQPVHDDEPGYVTVNVKVTGESVGSIESTSR